MPVLNIGLPDRFVEQGSREELLAICRLDATGIIQQIEEFCA
jgi:1-deoxy-D-xylulose-5-phosphate synthase